MLAEYRVLDIAPVQPLLQKKLSSQLNISPILAQILINRGISSPLEAERFLNARIDDMFDPFCFSDMQKAILRLKKAAEKKEEVLIFGDYDVDGITAVAILENALRRHGLKVKHYLPHRLKEGYGLNRNIFKIVQENNISLLLTADCGISSIQEIKQLKEKGIDTIVTDHHQPLKEELPEAVAILNPKVKKSGYPFFDLAGVGVAYKLAQALLGERLIEELDLVTLGTVADLVPLTEENRIMVKEGLKRIPESKRTGLKALINQTGLRTKNFTPDFINFILAPRLNAAGRVSSALQSLRLLLTEDEHEAEELVSLLEEHNRLRQSLEAKILEEAEGIINREINFKEEKVIVVAKEDWHAGVLGIVASKLAERFYRPVIVISLDEKICKGSGRSIKNFHLFDALSQCREFLNTVGGHAHAAGITISRDSIKEFKESINQLAAHKLSLEDLLPKIEIDLELKLEEISQSIAEEIEKLSPFGPENPEPLFFTRNLKLRGEPRVLARQTLKFYVTDGILTYPAIGFGMAGLKQNLLSCNSFDLVYALKLDDWQQEPSLLLEAKDIFLR